MILPRRSGRQDTEMGKQRMVLPVERLLRSGWEAIDPLYIWSAAVGLFVAFVLIAVATVIQSGHWH